MNVTSQIKIVTSVDIP